MLDLIDIEIWKSWKPQHNTFSPTYLFLSPTFLGLSPTSFVLSPISLILRPTVFVHSHTSLVQSPTSLGISHISLGLSPTSLVLSPTLVFLRKPKYWPYRIYRHLVLLETCQLAPSYESFSWTNFFRNVQNGIKMHYTSFGNIASDNH